MLKIEFFFLFVGNKVVCFYLLYFSNHSAQAVPNIATIRSSTLLMYNVLILLTAAHLWPKMSEKVFITPSLLTTCKNFISQYCIYVKIQCTCKYQPALCLAKRLIQLRKQLKRQSARLQRLKMKISQQCICETIGVAIDDSLHSDLRATNALPDCTDIMQQYPKDSFPHIF